MRRLTELGSMTMEPKPIPPEEFEITAENPMGARYRWKECPQKADVPGCACFFDRIGIMDLCPFFNSYLSANPACEFLDTDRKPMVVPGFRVADRILPMTRGLRQGPLVIERFEGDYTMFIRLLLNPEYTIKLPEKIRDEDRCQRGPDGKPLRTFTPMVPFLTLKEWRGSDV